MRISDWSSDVCSSDLIAQCEERYGQLPVERVLDAAHALMNQGVHRYPRVRPRDLKAEAAREAERQAYRDRIYDDLWRTVPTGAKADAKGSEEHTSELQSLMRISYAVFCLKKTRKTDT